MVNQLVLSALVAGAVFALVALSGSCVAVARGRSTILAVAVGLATLGAAGWLTFWAWFFSPLLGRLTGSALLVAAGAVTVVCLRRPAVRATLLAALPAVTMVVGLAAVTVALIGLWGLDRDAFFFARSRFSHYLPVDGSIPHMMVERLVLGEDPRSFLRGWQSSDRATLQSGLLLLAHPLTGALGLESRISGLTAGIAAQMMWLPSIGVLIKSLGGGRRGAFAGMLFAATSGTVLVNTVYTWPKLLSAAFLLAALAVLLDPTGGGGRLSRGALGLTGALIALAMLAHSAAAFALPIVLLVLFHRWRALSVRGSAVLAATAVVTYLPWALYQRFYDPPGTRLLSWHLAGIKFPEPGDGGVWAQVVDAYAAVGWRTAFENKVANLVTLADVAPWTGLSLSGIDQGSKRSAEFFSLSAAVGLGWIGVLAVLAVVALSSIRRRERDGFAGRVVLLLGFALGSLVVWALVLFGPGTTVVQHGSHVVILVALALPLAWLADRRPVPGALVTALGVTTGLITYVPGAFSAPVSNRALALAVAGALCVVAAFVWPSTEPTGVAVPAAPAIRTGVLPVPRDHAPEERRDGASEERHDGAPPDTGRRKRSRVAG